MRSQTQMQSIKLLQYKITTSLTKQKLLVTYNNFPVCTAKTFYSKQIRNSRAPSLRNASSVITSQDAEFHPQA